ncbi:MAG TPA: cupredoxin domain-containing protein [Nitriliruptorales bacterium]
MSRMSLILLVLATLGLAACGGDGGDGGSDGGSAASVTIVAGDLFFEHDGTSTEDGALTVEVAAGQVEVTLDNQGSTLHNFVIEELGDQKLAEAEGGGSDAGTVTLESGSYTFYCDIEGHREVGMQGTVTAG